MRKTVVLATMLCTSLFTNAQDTDLKVPEEKWEFGFNLGANYSQLYQPKLPLNINFKNKPGLLLGINAEHRISKLFTYSPEIDLSFTNYEYNILNPDGSNSVNKIKNTWIEVKNHLILKTKSDKAVPYFVLGPSLKFNLQNNNTSTSFKDKTDLGIDLGIGLSKPLTSFKIEPELRYSYDIMSTQLTPQVPAGTKVNSISLILSFVG